jgi:hypothetical protein
MKKDDFVSVVPKRKKYADSKERREGELCLTVRKYCLGIFSTRCLDTILKGVNRVSVSWNSEDYLLKMRKTERTLEVSTITRQENKEGTKVILARVALASVFSSIGLREVVEKKTNKGTVRCPIVVVDKDTWVVNLESFK